MASAHILQQAAKQSPQPRKTEIMCSHSTKGKILIALNTTWNLVNFRAGLIRALVAAGYEVVAAAPEDEYAPRLASLGCRYVALPMDNSGTHPGRDLLLLFRFFRLLREERPDAFLGYTVKPNIYGSLAARACGIRVVNNIAGLGTVFLRQSWLTILVRFLYRMALRRSYHVFFQNSDDMRLFLEQGLVAKDRSSRLPGSGVNIEEFRPVPTQPGMHPFRFLLVSRLLRDKGIGEYVEAARMLRQQQYPADFQILGFLDVKNPTAISRAQMEDWTRAGIIKYLGATDDVRPYLAAADCIVLPSYREGVPRSLLEAAAMGKPIVTTDVPGCRDVVDDGVNGFLCKPRDAASLAGKMKNMIELTHEERASMGLHGREKAVREFDERVVIERYLEVVSGE